MSYRAIILGCGSSGGVPRIGSGWGACNPDNPRNRRRRCSLLLERHGSGGVTRVLVDTSPDVREQLLDADARHLDGVLFTHEHADHSHGIDDLRALAIHQRRRIDVHMDEPTSIALRRRFGYCFETPPGSSYPPILREHRLEPGLPVQIDGPGGVIEALPVIHDHGDIKALGFRFGSLGYSPDVNGMPDESAAALRGLDIWIVDALRFSRHPSHWSLQESLGWIERIAPRQAIITNMHVDIDYDAVQAHLPANVVPAYDGMEIAMDGAARIAETASLVTQPAG